METTDNKTHSDKISLLPLDFKQKDSAFFYTAYFASAGWAILQFISVIIISVPSILNVITLVSIAAVTLMSVICILCVRNVFIKRSCNQHRYNVFRSFLGYGVVLTYIFTSLPRMTGTFNGTMPFGYAVFSFILTLHCFALALTAYIFVLNPHTRMVTGIFGKADIEQEYRIKKDKKLKKQEQLRLRKERSIWQNLWYEWIDVLLQAIIIALVIQQFVFQMYQIPSESMVPTFLIGDRVIVNKFIYGAHIPLTDWKLPAVKQPKVGDIVVFQNPDESVAYENAFIRVMHPFIYMMTLSLVDIDRKPDGSPKEKFIVKRLAAKSGEKLCVVNDKVYKKTSDSQWTLMSDIAGQAEYGSVDIYSDSNPRVRAHRMSQSMRYILDGAEYAVTNCDMSVIADKLETEKSYLLSMLRERSVQNVISAADNITKSLTQTVYTDIDMLCRAEHVVYNIGSAAMSLSAETIYAYQTEYERLLREHYRVCVYRLISDMRAFLQQSSDISYFDKEILTGYAPSENESPYQMFMKRFNMLYKYQQLNVFNKIFRDTSIIDKIFADEQSFSECGIADEIRTLDKLHVYLHGTSNVSQYQMFELRNFPEYPAGRDEYLDGEYFVMGDNRYNSLDSRFGHDDYEVCIDDSDKTAFSAKVSVSWKPHTIKDSHLLGKAIMIYFPLDRIGLLK